MASNVIPADNQAIKASESINLLANNHLIFKMNPQEKVPYDNDIFYLWSSTKCTKINYIILLWQFVAT